MFLVVERHALGDCVCTDLDQAVYSMCRRFVALPLRGRGWAKSAATPISGVNSLESTNYSKVGGGGSSKLMILAGDKGMVGEGCTSTARVWRCRKTSCPLHPPSGYIEETDGQFQPPSGGGGRGRDGVGTADYLRLLALIPSVVTSRCCR
jgi:hypothetical protein